MVRLLGAVGLTEARERMLWVAARMASDAEVCFCVRDLLGT